MIRSAVGSLELLLVSFVVLEEFWLPPAEVALDDLEFATEPPVVELAEVPPLPTAACVVEDIFARFASLGGYHCWQYKRAVDQLWEKGGKNLFCVITNWGNQKERMRYRKLRQT